MVEEQLNGEPQPDQDEADVEAMQAELDQLRQQVDEHQTAAKAGHHRGRAWAVGLLLVVGLILLGVANLTFWLRGTVLNTNRWVNAVGPLTQNETVANAISTAVVGSLFELVEVDQVVAEALPPEFAFLSGALARVLEDVAQETGTTLVQSDQFNAVWTGANRAAHKAIMGVLRGNGDLLYLREGQLTVDLTDLFDFATETLRLDKLERLDEIQTRFVILENQQVAAAQQALALIDGIGLLIPILALVFLFLAWLVSLWRRRTVLWLGIGVAITMVVSLILFALIQPLVLMYLMDPFVRLLAGEIWTVVARGLYIQTIVLLVIGLLIAGGAALAGPSPRAEAIRSGTRNGWNRLWRRQDDAVSGS